jgi:hypothetical protein
MPETKSFIKLKSAVKEEYLGKKVPLKYQKRYGKKYGKKDVKSFSFAIARAKNIKTH